MKNTKPTTQLASQLIRLAEKIDKLKSGSELQHIAQDLGKHPSATLRKINAVLLPAISQAEEREKFEQEQKDRLNASINEDNAALLELISSMDGYIAAKEMGQVKSPQDYLAMLPFMKQPTRPKPKQRSKATTASPTPPDTETRHADNEATHQEPTGTDFML